MRALIGVALIGGLIWLGSGHHDPAPTPARGEWGRNCPWGWHVDGHLDRVVWGDEMYRCSDLIWRAQ